MGESHCNMSNAPNAAAGQEDFIKGWPHPSLIDYPEFTKSLGESYAHAIQGGLSATPLNYGTAELGSFMLGHPDFLEALGGFLSQEYGREVPTTNLMATGGASMATDIACRCHAAHGDIAVTEAPTYYLAHQMFRERGLELRDVGMQEDGMDLDALEALCQKEAGKVKLVYTVPVHHNPTGITMCNEKRTRLMALARQYDFKVLADEAYQLVSFEDSGVVSLAFHDDASDPRCISMGTFAKIIGPGIKVGWIQAHPDLLKPMANIGFINSGNNPVIFNSAGLTQFIRDGGLAAHIKHCMQIMGAKKDLLVKCLIDAGLEPYNPKGGYFVWVKSKGKMTGRSGNGMCLDPPDQFADYMRLCFAWLTEEQIEKGVAYLKE